jgi:hypothetical protein
VALVGADPAAVRTEREALLVVGRDDPVELLAGDVQRGEDVLDLGPTGRVELQSDLVGLVAQVPRQTF